MSLSSYTIDQLKYKWRYLVVVRIQLVFIKMQKRHLISRHQKLQIFSLWISRACKTSFLCVESQSVCIVWFICYTIKSHVQSKFKSISGLVAAAVKVDPIILHVIALYFPLAHYDFLRLWYLFVTYTLLHLHRGFEICSSYETYIIIWH